MFELKGKNGRRYWKSSERIEKLRKVNLVVRTNGKFALIVVDGGIGRYETLASFSYPKVL